MSTQVDLERYDRQNRTYGSEATKTLSNSTVVVAGLRGGLATESCKNLLLSGVKNLILVEDGEITRDDLQTGFYYQDSNIGSMRHDILAKKLSELNPYCNIVTSNFNDVDWTNKVVILHNTNSNHALTINKLTRENNSKFVWVNSMGVAGSVFVDCNIKSSSI